MYQIYCIAYKISDEMKRQKEEEKPFWWEHMHDEVREKEMQHIDKMLLDAGVEPDVVKEMNRKEKYLAVSEGCYAVDCEEYERKLEALERTAILNVPKNNLSAQMNGIGNGAMRPFDIPSPKPETIEAKVEEVSFEPLGTPIQESQASQEDINTPPTMENSLNSSDNDMIKDAASKITDDELNDDSKKKSSYNFVGNMNKENNNNLGNNLGEDNKMEIRKMAQSIVRETVNKINSKADSVPQSIAPNAEQAILRAVIDELQVLR